jgi:hypothetical protein
MAQRSLKRQLKSLEERLDVHAPKPQCPTCGRSWPGILGAIEEDRSITLVCMNCSNELPEDVLRQLGRQCIICLPRKDGEILSV